MKYAPLEFIGTEHIGWSADKISILDYRIFLSGELLSVGSLFHRLQYNRHLEHVFQGFDLFEFGRKQHIRLSAIFDWSFFIYTISEF